MCFYHPGASPKLEMFPEEVYCKLENCHGRNWSPDQGMKNPSPYKQHWGLEQPCALPEAGLPNLIFKTSPSQEDAQVIISSCKVPHRKKKINIKFAWFWKSFISVCILPQQPCFTGFGFYPDWPASLLLQKDTVLLSSTTGMVFSIVLPRAGKLLI